MHPLKQKRLQQLQRQQDWLSQISSQLQAVDQRFFWYRLVTFITAWVGALAVRFIFPGIWWLFVFIVFLIAFLVVVAYHRRLDRQRRRYQSTLAYVRDQIARLSLEWDALPQPGAAQPEQDHPFAADLDLFGSHSLTRLLDTTISGGGMQRLHSWLLQPVLDLAELQNRQVLLKELQGLPALRRAYFTTDAEKTAPQRWEDGSLLGWLSANPPGSSLNTRLIILSSLAVINILLLALNLAGVLAPFWQFGLILYAGLYLFKYRQFKELFQDAYSLSLSLGQIKDTFLLLEKYPYPAGGRLQTLTAGLRSTRNRPSQVLRKLARLTSAASLQNNQILWLLVNLFIPWDLWFARLLDQYKLGLAQHLPHWLDIWYAMDALMALANFAALNPEYTFPQLYQYPSAKGLPLLSASALGHPLIAAHAKVCNDFEISELGQIDLISGSNMSGKSTFLRTVGINLVLAYSGAPVDASRMDSAIMRVYTSIQVLDSLSDGFSYFYAEVRRLKRLLLSLQEKEKPPVFYLIDEIFRGTNNHERRIGSQAYIRALAKAAGSGVISTHDLELTRLAETNPRIHNFHFRDDVLDGKMSFDYRLRQGPSPSTNALKIMQIEGLPVDGDSAGEPNVTFETPTASNLT